MRLQFQGVTVYSGKMADVVKAFDEHTRTASKPRTVGAFYETKNGLEAVVLDNVDYDRFCEIHALGDLHDRRNPGKDREIYFYCHPSDIPSYFAEKIQAYITPRDEKDALKLPFTRVKL